MGRKDEFTPEAWKRVLENARKRRAADPEKFRERGRKAMRKAYASDPDKYRQRNSEEQKRRFAADPALFYAKRAKRRKLEATAAWANDFVIEEMYSLARLRTKATGIKWEVDHIVPLQSDLVCGLHCEANIQVIPKTQNVSKGNRYWPDHPDPTYRITLSSPPF